METNNMDCKPLTTEQVDFYVTAWEDEKKQLELAKKRKKKNRCAAT